MPWPTKAQASSAGGGSVKVGSTGKVSTLMMQELEERVVRRSVPQSSSSLSRSKLQAEPVSVHCGALPRKPLIKWRRKTTPSKHKPSSSSSNGGVAHHHHRGAKPTHAAPRTFGHRAPMLRPHDDDDADDDIEGGVDVRCGNLLSGRLSKLGFSKLSGSATQDVAAAAASASSSSCPLRRSTDLESQLM